MTRTPHDNFAKDYFQELLSPVGKVEISREVTDEARQIDILFSPSSPAIVPPESLGLLGRLVTQTSSIEIFRNQPNLFQVLMCANKLYSYFAELNRQARREDTSLDFKGLGKLLIISTTASVDLLEGFGATLDSEINCDGVYSFPKNWFGSIIAVNKLPVTNGTLWLRILGKGKVQRNAVDELLALPDTNVYKQSTLRLIANWRILTMKQSNLTDEDQEIIMNLSTAYVEWEQKTLEQGKESGREEGRLEGEQKIILRLVNQRFGEIGQPLIEQIRKLSTEQLEELTDVLFTLSATTDLEQWLENRLKSMS
ncbi:DUF4351 domain-containing protein [Aetokthonos hydrillicola Thurmond2011]|jgi:hypothetical protein|uniref:DUF4351 domain-containing protein n=1 Tax=Aetokthonos hydrillicola Thurmond2011 TaxID=2712845 RepID=A0AAP5MDX4_9CYAN|nr:DUF4351 domain-containing protein [Aetokthonos hydrillicola]MBO3461198.1 DUF4351 domain-containing protein [Aetokthonos hydrillicola CCALA 1050]MBW4589748.1 DUF4351 domain-containing protein [Aetokthonos hydrillicola CCALA 1050]MDR9900243.1 DUF4351 domain-containing protein [Aetokthonos hydrillicola Thurmond2011]